MALALQYTRSLISPKPQNRQRMRVATVLLYSAYIQGVMRMRMRCDAVPVIAGGSDGRRPWPSIARTFNLNGPPGACRLCRALTTVTASRAAAAPRHDLTCAPGAGAGAGAAGVGGRGPSSLTAEETAGSKEAVTDLDLHGSRGSVGRAGRYLSDRVDTDTTVTRA